MVQIQSTWFPLYDRNPQTFVDNIFFATPADYLPATHTIHHTPDQPSAIELPVIAGAIPGYGRLELALAAEGSIVLILACPESSVS